MNVRKLKSILICLLITALGAVIWTEFFLSQRNIPAFKKDWHLYHREFLNPNIVTLPIYTSSYAFQGYRLKSNHDLGFIRLMSDQPSKPTSGKIFFSLKDGGFVDVLFNSTDTSYKAIRLSRSKIYPSGFYESKSNEEYLTFKALPILPERGINSAVISEGKISIDDMEIDIPELKFEQGESGVQVSPSSAEVISINFDGHHLNFFPDGNRWPLYLRHFAMLTIFIFLLGILPSINRNKIAFLLTGTGAIFLLSDIVIGLQMNQTPVQISDKFRAMDKWWTPEGETLEEKMKALKKDDSDTALFLCRKDGCARAQVHIPLPPKTGHRIAIFGGSQSKYALVRKYEESMHFRFDQLIRKSIPNVETINISTPGLFPDRIKAFGEKIFNVQMDTLIIESKVAELEYQSIRKFLEECRKRSVSVILLRTPQNILNYDEVAAPVVIQELLKGLEIKMTDIPDNYLWQALRNVEFINEMKNEFHFKFLDPNTVFLKEDVMKSGQLFWDKTHMTIHGQNIFAGWLAEEYPKLN